MIYLEGSTEGDSVVFDDILLNSVLLFQSFKHILDLEVQNTGIKIKQMEINACMLVF